MSKDWRQYPQIFSIGKIEYMGDGFYDGILDAHNREFYIHWEDEIATEDMHSYESERLYYVWKMDPILTSLLDIKYPQENRLGALFTARYYAENHLIPYGIILERHLDRTRDER